MLWSATPTPFTKTMKIDTVAVRRLVEHHVRLGVQGIFVGGTCGEGPWMTDSQRRMMIRRVAAYAKGRLTVAAQVTDNSSARILENMKMARAEGANVAVIAPPLFVMNPRPQNLAALYIEAIRQSPLPVGIYDRGRHSSVEIPLPVLRQIYAERKVVLVKDSSTDPERMRVAIQARRTRKKLKLLNGDEFNCVRYLAAGYDGLLLGGGIFNGGLARMIMDAVQAGDIDNAEKLQQRMNRLMFDVYGGKKISCWLAGLKHLLVRMEIFRTTRNYPGYTLSRSCQAAITRALKREKAVLFPGSA
jgi:4-hydroxy-tetrahydrodipicolinate synthase